ncbi:unnamed protein product [Nezara viridula]|uniref:Lipase domain-containing protein n=1 Tax=Nezara viridula TaxID=85310 RepID=A0A9P0HAF4_NEZVI|nr:unnamed protein product [Nezara viridula]
MELCRIVVLSSVLASCQSVSDFSQDLKEPSVSFYLVTRKGQEVVLSRVFSYSDLTSRGYPEKLYVLFHGYGGSANTSSILLLANALLDHGEESILTVDYEAAVAVPYEKAVNRSLAIGEKVAELLSISSFPLRFIGNSLGAHIAGITGHILKEKNDILVDSIIGLDPAFPIFGDMELPKRLDPEDAKFVVAIHTTGGELGFLEPVGHADFYPNGGLNPQPQCVSRRKVWIDILVEIVCSHNAALEYLTESIGGGFPATKCSSWDDYKYDLCANWQTVRLGFDLPSDVRGMFFLRTRSGPPFGEPLYCSSDMKGLEAASCSTSDKEVPKDSPGKLLLILVSQCISVWLIYRFYPYE